jgi:drug/metabolite transporter (DMT)-like permease
MTHKLYGPAILLLSMTCAAIGTTFIRYLSQKYSPETILFYKSFWALMTLFCYYKNIYSFKKGFQESNFLPNMLRASFGTLGVWL